MTAHLSIADGAEIRLVHDSFQGQGGVISAPVFNRYASKKVIRARLVHDLMGVHDPVDDEPLRQKPFILGCSGSLGASSVISSMMVDASSARTAFSEASRVLREAQASDSTLLAIPGDPPYHAHSQGGPPCVWIINSDGWYLSQGYVLGAYGVEFSAFGADWLFAALALRSYDPEVTLAACLEHTFAASDSFHAYVSRPYVEWSFIDGEWHWRELNREALRNDPFYARSLSRQ